VRYAYYPGCSLHMGAKEYDTSWRAVCEVLGIDLVKMENWSCCGTVHATNVDKVLSLALAARNLTIGEDLGLEVVAACSGCYKNLRTADLTLKRDNQLQATVNASLPQAFRGEIAVKHPLYVIVDDLGLERLPPMRRPLRGLKVAPYYGCVLTRPTYLDPPDNPEQPMAMDHLLEALGADVVTFPAKAKCCGGAVLLSHTDVSVDLCGKLLKQAKDAGADCVAVACPMCQMALDMYQSRIEGSLGETLDLPILYFTQLMGLALGVEESRLGLNRLFVSPAKALAGV
jgi:heterodisulfide reductase subunit B